MKENDLLEGVNLNNKSDIDDMDLNISGVFIDAMNHPLFFGDYDIDLHGEFLESSIAQETVIDNDAKINAAIGEILRKLASSLSLDKQSIETIINELQGYYSKGYRHSYYNISLVIDSISATPDDINTLTMNIADILKNIKETYSYDKELVDKFKKFYDYVMLEAVRSKGLTEIKKAISESQKFEEIINKQKESLGGIEEKLRQAESGFISHLLSILGVFSGVIIAFFGSLEYLSSAFNSIADVSKYRLVFMTLLIGFIMFNTISIMMIFLAKMIGKNIYDKCKSENCSCEEKCSLLEKFKNRLSFVYYVNCVIIVAVIVDVVLWAFSKKIIIPF